MEITLLVKSIMGLVVILAILVFLLFFASGKKDKSKPQKNSASLKTSEQEEMKTDLDSLRTIIKRRNSTTKQLTKALDLIIKHHGTVHTKLGARSHPEFDIYMDILFTICRHQNTNKDIILKFNRDLERLNPEYKKEINEAITKGLNSRRV